MLERVKYENQLNWKGRINFKEKELLDEYPLADYIQVSDAFIKEERIHPTEVTENAKELGRRIDEINEGYRKNQAQARASRRPNPMAESQ